jgi:anti-anti-sigma regulatory factor
MGIQNLSEDVILITLQKEPKLCDELKSIRECVYSGCGGDVIVDFSETGIITSESISDLIVLLGLLTIHSYRLILCSVPLRIRCVLRLTGLEALFEFADDEYAALQVLRQGHQYYG